MVTIVGLEKRKAADGKEFNVINLQFSGEVMSDDEYVSLRG